MPLGMATSNRENTAAALRAKADALHGAGDWRAGAALHLKALAASTHDPDLAAAAAALSRKDLARAEHLLKRHLSAHPTDIGAIRMLAELAMRLGQYGDAQTLLDRALTLAPGFQAARFALALLLSRRNKLAEAIAETDHLLAESPGDLRYLNLRASVLVKLGAYDDALALYDRVIAARPPHPKILMSAGHVLKTVGRQDEGVAAYKKALALSPELGEAWWSLANLKTFRFAADDIAAMEAALQSPKASNDDRLHLHYALGKAFEDDACYETSFAHYADGAAIRRKLIHYDADDTSARVAGAKAQLTSGFFADRRDFGFEAADPIFIVGLPRAGSTLLEQILSSHPLVEGTMELPDLDQIARRLEARHGSMEEALDALTAAESRALGEEYLARTRVQRRQGRPFFIDKLPNNWVNVGLIALILPNAKIIDARRHPMSCCFSAWKQHFARGQHFSYDLGEIGRYYADYAAFMAHIDRALPGRVHRVIHENLVDDPDHEIRALLAILGLAFDQRCIDFHQNDRAVRTASSEQVRQPIFRDGLDQWRLYERWLEPLRTSLGETLTTCNAPAA